MAETRARFLANTIGATSASNDFTLPDGVGGENQVISSDGAGGTAWATTLSAPTISSVTGKLNEYEDGVSEDGGVLTINGTDFGNDASTLSVQISGTTGFNTIAETSTVSITSSGTQFTATFTGAETNYNHSSFSAGSTIYVKVTKSGLQTSTYATLGTAMTGDPSFSTTSTTASTHTGTLGATSLGSYGGQIAGGGQDSNTKLLLNFDRTGGTDIEDSSNIGGDGHKVTATNAVIKASPFGDGKSAMFFDGIDDFINIPASADWDFSSTDVTFEFWMNSDDVTNINVIMSSFTSANDNIAFYTYQSKLVFEDKRSGSHSGRNYQSGADLIANTWQHIAVVYDTSATTMAMYIDGKYSYTSGSSFSSLVDASSRPLQFGGQNDASAYEYSGYLDEIRIVKDAVYTSNFTVPISRLTAITNTKLLIHSDRHGGLSPETGDRRNYISVTDVGPLKQSGSTGTASQLIDGNTTATGSDTYWFHHELTSGHLLFDFKNSAIVNKFTWIQSSSQSHGQWTFSGSNDNSNFTDLKTNFDLVSGTSTDHTFTNTTAYRYYKLEKTGTGTTNHGPYTHEIQFFNTDDLSTAFTDSSPTTGGRSQHTITPTGSIHSVGHGGIAPALPFPASLKKTGSAGIYFDGSGDYISVLSFTESLSTSYSFEFYFNLQQVGSNQGLVYFTDSGNSGYMSLLIDSNNKLALYADDNGSSWDIANGSGDGLGSTNFNRDTWYHLLFVRVRDQPGVSNTYKIYINGSSSPEISISSSTNISSSVDEIMLGYNDSSYMKGYIDSFRWHSSALTAGSSAQPTQIYGAYRSQDVGTIQLNATAGSGGGALDYAELSGGTALSTYGLSLNQSTGAITGTLSGLDDNSNSGGVIRIRARANADDNRVTTLGGSSFTGITQNDNKVPTLFNARRYVGTGAVKDINGLGFQPDLLWGKDRDSTNWHILVDSVRGAHNSNNAVLYSNDPNAVDNPSGGDTFSGFNSDGFSLGTNGRTNGDGVAHICWAWKAGSAPSGNGKKIVDGVESSITSGASADYETLTNVKQSINTAGDFSITQFTGSNSDGWFKHGLSGKPDWIIVKRLTPANSWPVWHSGFGGSGGTGEWILLDSNQKKGYWNDGTDGTTWDMFGTIDTTKINLIGGTSANSPNAHICYAWKAVSGVSAFGSYSGGGAGSTVTVTTGFSPRFIMIKAIDSTSSAGDPDWAISDVFTQETATSTQGTGNKNFLRPNVNNGTLADSAYGLIEYTSTGFKVHSQNAWDLVSDSGTTYIYMAFA